LKHHPEISQENSPPLTPNLSSLFTALEFELQWFAGTPIRNVGTVGSNVVNASPISDLIPLFLATVCGIKKKIFD
jgi:xanthine dehydrogenase/oxidase